jgi:sulfoxide reductase heme-binding subunit YedZ
MSSQALWYLTRATGIIALVLLTATIVLGVLGTARVASQRWPRIVTSGLHRNLALTSTALVAVHVITTVLDPFAPISLAAAFIPFASSYRPVWLSLGAVAFDLLLAVLFTSLLRDRLSRRLWQGVHMLVYACWPVALWHGIGTGTDARLNWVLAIDAVCVLAVVAAAWWRLSLTGDRSRLTAGLTVVALLTVFTIVFVAAGPLQPDWALRAGTPPGLLSLGLLGAVV